MRTTRIIIATGLMAAAAPLQAQSYPPLHVDPKLKDCSVEFASTLTQDAFSRFVREFGSVSAYKQLSSASTLGQGRVMFGIEMMRFTVDEHAPAWNDTFAHPNDHHPLGSEKTFPKLKLRVGVTDDIDVGTFFAHNPEANYGWVGVDTKYSVLRESSGAAIGVAVRGAYTKTLYVKDMDMHSFTADVAAERTLWGIVRPYVGVGTDGVLARETTSAVNLQSENQFVPHAFGGVDVTLWNRLSIGAEYTRGPVPSTQIQVAAVAF